MRVKTGTVRHAFHKKVLQAAKGYWMTRHKRYKVAAEAVLHAGQYAYNGRRLRRRDLRKLWIIRLNAALKEFSLSYSKFINLAKNAKMVLNRKMLSELAINDPTVFKSIVNSVSTFKK
ncbi:50S ribosomal protein L20 [Candidatus Shapirobacteria bacterium CG06_land_8_20_14_3_00_40_12]|uniref:Large ribosomal subunit protein bL20 n=2 Tax=Candidatus Shapironibacteriota TaxID=1752721 RepID=A0A2M7TUA3_9BACT|nr:MAG: 50S ribosomal protein L20 [Candidatus Shapirobacteria bacterium CG06_land_8_20_14_3_00_40_12]PIZ61414.1 MAG: 50S ribosomal protein L20 [Candidatus Shapirobacteria bacterium CG_4_10_14_0_2_um_filter_40_12]